VWTASASASFSTWPVNEGMLTVTSSPANETAAITPNSRERSL
jgi:hypothetical protein